MDYTQEAAIAPWRDSALLIVTVFIEPSGKSSVTFERGPSSSEHLMRLALLYAAKTRWLLNDPIPSYMLTLSMYKDILTRLYYNYYNRPTSPQQTLTTILSEIRLQKIAGQIPWAVPGGEKFTVLLVKYEEPYGYGVQSSLPVPGLVFNYVWNFLVLLDEITVRLPPKDLEFLDRAMWELYPRLLLIDNAAIRTVRDALAFVRTADQVFDALWRLR
jgi:hypothetical protein